VNQRKRDDNTLALSPLAFRRVHLAFVDGRRVTERKAALKGQLRLQEAQLEKGALELDIRNQTRACYTCSHCIGRLRQRGQSSEISARCSDMRQFTSDEQQLAKLLLVVCADDAAVRTA
jgi:hypothetical protein